ncbi:Ankyrin repeats (3 copies) [Legionella donaldsonii]|uniref:Ankyrin repeats (3 copies) n=1 Tax=Legionella donaldsonii TaxID=45060 RepID=A0A378JAS8_9GAMM|nr:ankyrin repeat domain-containing protein [Legionella donaldsonii]STX41690.1 Ankyrin repeats (3 copies) [Legionella donaldsonii]
MSNKGDLYLTMQELMNLMIILGYPLTSQGLCYGYSYSAQLTMLGAELETFNQRSIKLAEIYRKLEGIAKESLLKIYTSYPPKDLQSHPDNSVGVLIEMLKKERFAKDKTEFNKLEKLKKELITEFTNSVKEISINKENAALQSQAYFDSVSVFHDISSITPNTRPSNQQNARLVMKLLTPIKLEKMGKKIHHPNAITGIFDHTALSQALSLMAKKMPPMDSPVSFEFASYFKVPGSGQNASEKTALHAIGVGFDPNKKEWLFADSMEHQIKRFPLGEEDKLAKEIVKEFTHMKEFKGGIAKPFYINPLLTDAKALEPFNQAVTELQNSQAWQQLQIFNQNKQENEEFLVRNLLMEGAPQVIEDFFSKNPYKQLITSLEIEGKPLINWFLWARGSDENIDLLLASFIKCGGVVNAKDSQGNLALNIYLADCWKMKKLMETDKKAIQFFLAHGADINARTSYKNPPLFHAVYHQSSDLVVFLVENGADPNLLSVNWDNTITSCLHLLIEEVGRGGNEADNAIKMVSLLLEHGADPHAGEDLNQGRSAFQVLKDERKKYPGFEGFKRVEELFSGLEKALGQSGAPK